MRTEQFIYHNYSPPAEKDKTIKLCCETIDKVGKGAHVVFLNAKNPLEEIQGIKDGALILVELYRFACLIVGYPNT